MILKNTSQILNYFTDNNCWNSSGDNLFFNDKIDNYIMLPKLDGKTLSICFKDYNEMVAPLKMLVVLEFLEKSENINKTSAEAENALIEQSG